MLLAPVDDAPPAPAEAGAPGVWRRPDDEAWLLSDTSAGDLPLSARGLAASVFPPAAAFKEAPPLDCRAFWTAGATADSRALGTWATDAAAVLASAAILARFLAGATASTEAGAGRLAWVGVTGGCAAGFGFAPTGAPVERETGRNPADWSLPRVWSVVLRRSAGAAAGLAANGLAATGLAAATGFFAAAGFFAVARAAGFLLFATAAACSSTNLLVGALVRTALAGLPVCLVVAFLASGFAAAAAGFFDAALREVLFDAWDTWGFAGALRAAGGLRATGFFAMPFGFWRVAAGPEALAFSAVARFAFAICSPAQSRCPRRHTTPSTFLVRNTRSAGRPGPFFA